jgi:hypothetical protein
MLPIRNPCITYINNTAESNSNTRLYLDRGFWKINIIGNLSTDIDVRIIDENGTVLLENHVLTERMEITEVLKIISSTSVKFDIKYRTNTSNNFNVNCIIIIEKI